MKQGPELEKAEKSEAEDELAGFDLGLPQIPLPHGEDTIAEHPVELPAGFDLNAHNTELQESQETEPNPKENIWNSIYQTIFHKDKPKMRRTASKTKSDHSALYPGYWFSMFRQGSPDTNVDRDSLPSSSSGSSETAVDARYYSLMVPRFNWQSRMRQDGQTPDVADAFIWKRFDTQAPALDFLEDFWIDRRQEESAAGDLGESKLRPDAHPKDKPSSHMREPSSLSTQSHLQHPMSQEMDDGVSQVMIRPEGYLFDGPNDIQSTPSCSSHSQPAGDNREPSSNIVQQVASPEAMAQDPEVSSKISSPQRPRAGSSSSSGSDHNFASKIIKKLRPERKPSVPQSIADVKTNIVNPWLERLRSEDTQGSFVESPGAQDDDQIDTYEAMVRDDAEQKKLETEFSTDESLESPERPPTFPSSASKTSEPPRPHRRHHRRLNYLKDRIGTLAENQPNADVDAWWLDISNPTPKDMRELRRMLPIHPLTAEDILLQEDREKCEVFPHLGYYFVAVRALDEAYFRARFEFWASNKDLKFMSRYRATSSSDDSSSTSSSHHIKDFFPWTRDDNSDSSSSSSKKSSGTASSRFSKASSASGVEGVGVGAVNLYLVVFPDGLLSFHYGDTDRHVRHVYRLMEGKFAQSQVISSHGIAYGILDSIIDSFIPFVDFLSQESEDLVNFVSNRSAWLIAQTPSPFHMRLRSLPIFARLRRSLTFHDPAKDFSMKTTSSSRMHPADAILDQTVEDQEALFNRLDNVQGMHFLSSLRLTRQVAKAILFKLTDARRVVTGMSRLLTTKVELTKTLSKHFSTLSSDWHVYITDLQDHAISMHQSLMLHETTISDEEASYAGYLRLNYLKTKNALDRIFRALNVVVFVQLFGTTITTSVGMNVQVPEKLSKHTGTVLADFAILIGILTFMLSLFVCGIVYFENAAPLRQKRKNAIPSTGFISHKS